MHTPETLLKMARAFEVRPERARRRFDEVGRAWVEWRGTTPDGSGSWCISDDATTLSRDGLWEFEPRPSAREDDDLARTRWPSAVEAIAFVEAFLAANPTGRLPEEPPEAIEPLSGPLVVG